MLDQDGHSSQGAPKRQATDIPHEDFSRIGVEPEKSQTGADQCPPKNGDLAATLDIGNEQIAGKLRMSRQIGDHGERQGRDDQRASSKAVKRSEEHTSEL